MSLLPLEKECLRLQIESAAGHGCVEEYGLSVRATMPGHSHHDPEANLEPTPDNERVIDREGFRPNVGIVVCNDRDQVLWGAASTAAIPAVPAGWNASQRKPRAGHVPRTRGGGGSALKRWSCSDERRAGFITDCQKRFIRHSENPVCIGQKQIWFLLRLISEDSAVRLDAHDDPEFDHWRWVSYWYPVSAVVDFKQEVYRQALSQLSPFWCRNRAVPPPAEKAVMLEVLRRLIQDVNDADSLEDALGLIVAQ